MAAAAAQSWQWHTWQHSSTVHEARSDENGLKLLQRAGFDIHEGPKMILKFEEVTMKKDKDWDKLKAEERQSTHTDQPLNYNSHAPQERQEHQLPEENEWAVCGRHPLGGAVASTAQQEENQRAG